MPYVERKHKMDYSGVEVTFRKPGADVLLDLMEGRLPRFQDLVEGEVNVEEMSSADRASGIRKLMTLAVRCAVKPRLTMSNPPEAGRVFWGDVIGMEDVNAIAEIMTELFGEVEAAAIRPTAAGQTS